MASPSFAERLGRFMSGFGGLASMFEKPDEKSDTNDVTAAGNVQEQQESIYDVILNNKEEYGQYIRKPATSEASIETKRIVTPEELNRPASEIADHEFYPELCEALVKKDGMNLQYIPERLKDARVSAMAVVENPRALQFVPENVLRSAMEYVPKEYHEYMNQFLPKDNDAGDDGPAPGHQLYDGEYYMLIKAKETWKFVALCVVKPEISYCHFVTFVPYSD